jgi:hypothetical protein
MEFLSIPSLTIDSSTRTNIQTPEQAQAPTGNTPSATAGAGGSGERLTVQTALGILKNMWSATIKKSIVAPKIVAALFKAIIANDLQVIAWDYLSRHVCRKNTVKSRSHAFFTSPCLVVAITTSLPSTRSRW